MQKKTKVSIKNLIVLIIKNFKKCLVMYIVNNNLYKAYLYHLKKLQRKAHFGSPKILISFAELEKLYEI